MGTCFAKPSGEVECGNDTLATNATNTVACLLFQGTLLNDIRNHRHPNHRWSNEDTTGKDLTKTTQLAMEKART